MVNQENQTDRFKVYIRWRPVSPNETKEEAEGTIYTESRSEQHSNSALSISSGQDQTSATSRTTGTWTSAASFAQIFPVSSGNRDVFDSAIAPVLPKVLKGATHNTFAYGHSGSGKTHTIIGYENDDPDQMGLCLAAAQSLFKTLDRINTDLPSRTADAEKVVEEGRRFGVGVRVFELRGKTAYDLLNDRLPCSIREGPDGRTHIRGETEMLEEGKVRVRPIVCRPCWSFIEVQEVVQAALQYRSMGSSSVHDQSSRTHAVLELEIINRQLLDAREAVVERQSELVPVGKWATDVYLEEQMKGLIQGPDGGYIANPDYTLNQERIDAAELKKLEHEKRVEAAESLVYSILTLKQHPCLGGKLVFVDLAGAEFFGQRSAASATRQTKQEEQEGRQINTDLFTLKEVIRARTSHQKRIPYRGSPLTMVLREHFSNSDDDSSSAMILTVSSASDQISATINTLKYGNLVGAAGQG